MNTVQLDTAIKFGSGRYRQEQGLLKFCGEEIARFAKDVLVLTGHRSWDAVKDEFCSSLDQAGIRYRVEHYDGRCSYEGAREYADLAQSCGAQEIVGVGGGLICDFAKAVAEYAGVGCITVPTSASTCAPFTCMSVMYTPEGAKKDCWRYEHEIDAVLVDTQVIASCPHRYNAAGILDAMAKKIEILDGKPQLDLSATPINLYSAFHFAADCYDILAQEGPRAIEDNRRGEATKAIDDMAFVNIATTGVIANITKSYSQSALAHAFYDGVRTHFTNEAAQALHGEIVAVGLFCQLYYNELPELESSLREYMSNMDLPLTLGELGIEPTEQNLDIIEKYLGNTRHIKNDEESRLRLHQAIREMV